jgi:hypothetical protein
LPKIGVLVEEAGRAFATFVAPRASPNVMPAALPAAAAASAAALAAEEIDGPTVATVASVDRTAESAVRVVACESEMASSFAESL